MKITDTREKGRGEVYGPNTREALQSKAFQLFSLYELGYGGRVTDLTETSVTVVTYIMRCKDTLVIEGTAAEMQPFLHLAAVHCGLLADDQARDALAGAAFSTMERMFSRLGDGVSPLHLKLAGGQIMGTISLKTSLMAAFDLDCLKHLKTDELVDAVMLILDGEPREEVLDAYARSEQAE